MAEASKSAETKPAETTPVDKVDLDKVKEKAPNITKEFVSEHKLDDNFLAKVARGEEPPPPTVTAAEAKGPAVTDGELHYTDGGWQITPKGVKPEDVGKDAISR